jgi:Replication initiator protein A
MHDVEVKLSDWVFNAIRHKEVLSLSRDYFRLRKPIERRVYELARKHCGRQSEWRITLALLQKKCGAESSSREFRRMMTLIIDEDILHSHIPDYSIRFDEGNEDMIVVRNRGTVAKLPVREAATFTEHISGDGYEEAKLAAQGWDVYFLEQEWRNWITEPPRHPDAAFVAFCRKWYERRGPPR